ncbi:hypothetical protein WICMUC_005656 [Wickerhamomyces mucosus]|uniref:Uncharacterized protein n=1 Tax=Wickerhamomyces mucosus TaxID=1378264 RepID=A0A9P8P6F7_9ASCO|nr:hypothetical protein WICMUC_005656 [Wickerhamomyces mucosus]
MLRLTRNLHNSSILFQESNSILSSRKEIDEYLQYFKTKRELRPLVYRKKNSSELLSRDLFNDELKTRIVPLTPPKLPSKSSLSKLIYNSSNIDELYKIRDELLYLSKKPKFTTSNHLTVYLEKSIQLRKLPHALTFLYSQKTLRNLLNQDNLNFIYLLIYLNPFKSFEQKLHKLNISFSKIRSKDLISDLLKASIYLQFDEKLPEELINQLKNSKLELSNSLDINKNIGSLSKIFKENRLLYLQLKPISLQFTQIDGFNKFDLIVKIDEFVKNYEIITKTLNKPNQFEEFKQSALFGKPN